MSLTESLKYEVENILTSALKNKFKRYKPESSSMPFHTRLLGKDRMALFSFIHSLNTNFGSSIFEPVAEVIAKNNFIEIERQYKVGDKISDKSFSQIQKIIDDLRTTKEFPNKLKEIELLRNVETEKELRQVKLTLADIKLIDRNGKIYLLDLKTSKPNAGNFIEFKRTLLEWVAAVFTYNNKAEIQTLIAIPYNPYAPKPYSRWTMRGMIDINQELLVAEEFWDFLAGEGTYQELLNIFEKVGIDLRDEIDDYFKQYND